MYRGLVYKMHMYIIICAMPFCVEWIEDLHKASKSETLDLCQR